MSIESLSGSRFFLLFIDDFSRMTWCYFPKNKSEVSDSFVNFRAQVEKEVGTPIKVLRTDNGGEYTSFEFEEEWHCATEDDALYPSAKWCEREEEQSCYEYGTMLDI